MRVVTAKLWCQSAALESTGALQVERENESVCIVGHQAILRCVYAYFMQVPREEVRYPTPVAYNEGI